ncbi:potassium transporter [Altererythrobacter sp. BO-6]|uniref:cation:proton antiporter domain-containing protein n=1 Tax=Altererythrobacter sp. BO-6 TaxID=2604537 RepID=UPI0013E10CB7|nr:cation:proton antiporter [Altererythrobacter sp. BO-6]QIG52928.1 potassium transporter [Altererythrobacter sp. BO-6]
MAEFLLLAFLILIAGVAAVPLASRFGLGSVLGYLLAGMAISPLLGALDVDVEAMQVFAEFGVVMMLFIVGLELEPKRLWDMRGKLIGLGGGQVLLTTLAIAAIGLIYGNPWQTALAIGMVLALSSTAIIVQTLNEKGLLRSEGGEASFSVLLVQDIAVIPILALIPLLALPELAGVAGGHGGGGGHGGLDLTAHMSGWLAALVRIGAVGAVVAIGIYAIRPLFRYIAAANLRELFTAAALVVVIGIALLMSLVGLSPALGAFVAGVVLATSEYRHELESDVDPFKGLLLGLFFITVGAGIDFALASERFGEVVFWALVTIATKSAVLLAIGWSYGLRRQALWLFCLSLPQAGEFAFVLISFALANAVFSRDLADLLLLIVALTMLLTPLLFILYDKVIARAYATLGDEREPDAIDEENEIILAGRGRVGGIVDRILDLSGYRATVIDYDSRHIEQLKKFGVRSYFGDATRPDLLASAGIARAKLLVVALDEKDQIDKLVGYVAANYPHVHITARAIDRDHVYKLWALGCRDIIRETYDGSLRIGRSALEALGHDRQSAQAMVDVFEEMDRSSMRELADLYKIDVPSWENEPLLAKIREMRAEWDPKLREQIDEIVKRGR